MSSTSPRASDLYVVSLPSTDLGLGELAGLQLVRPGPQTPEEFARALGPAATAQHKTPPHHSASFGSLRLENLDDDRVTGFVWSERRILDRYFLQEIRGYLTTVGIGESSTTGEQRSNDSKIIPIARQVHGAPWADQEFAFYFEVSLDNKELARIRKDTGFSDGVHSVTLPTTETESHEAAKYKFIRALLQSVTPPGKDTVDIPVFEVEVRSETGTSGARVSLLIGFDDQTETTMWERMTGVTLPWQELPTRYEGPDFLSLPYGLAAKLRFLIENNWDHSHKITVAESSEPWPAAFEKADQLVFSMPIKAASGREQFEKCLYRTAGKIFEIYISPARSEAHLDALCEVLFDPSAKRTTTRLSDSIVRAAVRS